MSRLENANSYRRADVKTLLRKANDVVAKEVEGSAVFEAAAEVGIPRFDSSELVLGRVIGRGGFCSIRELSAIRLASQGGDEAAISNGSGASRRKKKNLTSKGSSGAAHEKDDSDTCGRELLARRVWLRKGGKFVVKQVEKELFHCDRVTYLKGTIDIALETKFLASLDHPHILKIRGLARVSPFDDMNYFLILDQLPEILNKRLTAWMHQKRATRGVTGLFTGGKRKVLSLLTERLFVAYDIAEALDYLHNRNIIYRDLKPDNVGFDSEGTVKIFDFGLAKELREEERDDDGLYNMTGFTGAIRYMAPEVGLRQPYNLKADVYSWSMVMWYIMALEPPMGLYTPKMFIDRVFAKGYRPAIKIKWSERIGNLMRACWSETIDDRPDFAEVRRTLKAELVSLDPQNASFVVDGSERYLNHE